MARATTKRITLNTSEEQAAENRRLDIEMRMAALSAAVAVKADGATEQDLRRSAAWFYRTWLLPPEPAPAG